MKCCVLVVANEDLLVSSLDIIGLFLVFIISLYKLQAIGYEQYLTGLLVKWNLLVLDL